MRILDFGNPQNPRLLLLHGFQCPHEIWERYIRHYEEHYHILVPILPGHDSETDEEFTSFADAAAQIEEFCLHHFGNRIHAAFALSMGGVLAATLWQNGRLTFDKLIFDGSPLVSFHPPLRRMFLRFYLDITHKSQQRDRKTLKQAVGSIVTREQLPAMLRVLDHMTDTTIVNCLTGVFTYRLPSQLPGGTKVWFFHGTAINEFYAKKSAKFLAKHHTETTVTCFQGKGHCEYSLLQPDYMLQQLDTILR